MSLVEAAGGVLPERLFLLTGDVCDDCGEPTRAFRRVLGVRDGRVRVSDPLVGCPTCDRFGALHG